MIALARMLARGGSPRERARGRLMAAGAALAVLLLCSAVSLLTSAVSALDRGTRLGLADAGSGEPVQVHGVMAAFATPDRRAVTALVLALLAVPAAAFVHQVSRLAAATRERRLAALRLAGATPGDVRLLGAYEGGRQALVGGVCGAAVYLAGAWALGGASPLTALGVLLGVALWGMLSGLLAGRHVIASPLGVTRRSRPAQAHVRDLVMVTVGGGLMVAILTGKGRLLRLDAYGMSAVLVTGAVLLLFGLVLSAAWLIGAAARRVGHRTGEAETLLAARMLEADPRGWARALSVVGLTVFFGAMVGAQQGPGIVKGYVAESPFAVTAYALVDLSLLFALVVSAAALVAHQAEALLDHRGSFAALAASGTEAPSLGRVLARQALIASLPVCAVAAVAGAAVVIATVPEVYAETPAALAVAGGRAVVMAGIGILAALVVARLSRPLLRRTAAPERLRDE
ncbi:hypothetical protein [Nonomuraea sp. NPDC005501]|uniref:hypothetical protein n=1 Tax=Nonomuraea sp. NPDC005501 TaxID=3156884 RepID=UPI0033A60CF6